MAIYKPKKESIDFFKPDFYINYKAVDWVFSIYNTTTKELSTVDSLSFYSIINVKKFLTKDLAWNDFKSDIFENIFSDKIRLRDESYRYVWTYKFSAETKGLVNLDWSKTDFIWKTATIMIWILENWKTISLDLGWWTVGAAITRRDKEKTNLEDVKIFEESSFITLAAKEETTKVWTGKKTKLIHFLSITWDTRDIPDNLVELWESVAEKISAELKRNQEWQTTSSNKMTEVVEDEISIEDLPF